MTLHNMDWDRIYKHVHRFGAYHNVDPDLVSACIEEYLTKYSEKAKSEPETIAYLKSIVRSRNVDSFRRKKAHINPLTEKIADKLADDIEEFEFDTEEERAIKMYQKIRQDMYEAFSSHLHFDVFFIYVSDRKKTIRQIGLQHNINYSATRRILFEAIYFLRHQYKTPIPSFIGRIRNANRKPITIKVRKHGNICKSICEKSKSNSTC